MSMTRPPSLSPSFWFLNISQFLGALNDNIFRGVMALALIARASDSFATGTDESPLFIAGIVFALPFILFSSSAGVMADRFSKRRLIIMTNTLEVAIMTLGLWAFLSNSPFLIYSVLLLMAAQSTLFGPCKLGILPEIVPTHGLAFANGLMEMFTYLAIILGTVGAALVFGLCDGGAAFASTALCWRASILCIALATAGLIFSLFIKDTGVRASKKRPTPFFWKTVARNIRYCRKKPALLLTLIGTGFFLFLGGYVQLNVVPYGVEALGLSKAWSMNLFLALAFGIGVGSYLAGRISGRGVEIGLVPLGILLFAAMLILLAFPLKHVLIAGAALFLMGVGGGFYIVPLNAYLQKEAPAEDRGELIATSYFLSFVGLAAASGILLLLDEVLGVGPRGRFLVLGAGTLILTGYVIRVLPDHLIRFIARIVLRAVYRIRVVGAENVPARGGALLVANHAGLIDAPLMLAAQSRRIRFLMERSFFERKPWTWLYRLFQVIPVSQKDGPKEILRSIKAARQALDEGYMVGVFGEGAITRTGNVMEFKKGFERIVKGSNHPVIPVHLHGVWGSRFSYGQDGIRKNGLRRRIIVSFGASLPPETVAFQVRQAVLELGAQAFELDKKRYKPLPLEFARTARSLWKNKCMADGTGRELTFGSTLSLSLALAGTLREGAEDERHIGLLLPSSVGGALANLAASFLGKIPVNLNYTASREALESSLKKCGIKRVITSRRFFAKMKPAVQAQWLFIEDLMQDITWRGSAKAWLKARFCPLSRLMPRIGAEDVAAVIFSSGSTAEPKGIELSHANILANIRSTGQVFRLGPNDVVCGVLPFFHSFGFMGTLWLPLILGTGTAYHANPMEADAVGRLAAENRCTFLVSTPTFLSGYLRRVSPECFRHLRTVITGAEKLKDRVAAAFEKRFGIKPLEGYGSTELSPVASVNLLDVAAGGVRQKGQKPGSIGLPLPGVVMKVVDLEDKDKELNPGEEGLLLVKGPNVMKGYMNDPKRTNRVLEGGWYVTGDVARIDHDGFVTLTDRLSRFSKIGGEMVPHQAVEEALHQGLRTPSQAFAVTSLPDDKKGERLVVLHTAEGGDPWEVHRRLKELGLPNLWIPSPRDFYSVEEIPILGSGKVDLKGIKRLARKMAV